MDNAAHTLLGLALARTGLDRWAPLTTVTLLVAANLPDGDVLGQLYGGHTWYLCHHRGLTHALPGLVAQAIALAGVVFALGRWRAVQGVRFLPLLAVAALGLLSHLALDSLNTYGVRPWLPFDATRYHGDALFIVDPWLWLLLGAGACLGYRHVGEERDRARGWCFFVGLATVFMLRHALSGSGPVAVALLWPVLMACVIGARLLGVGRARPQAAAGLGLGLAACYVGGMFLLSSVAHERGLEVLRGPRAEVERTSTHPQAGRPWRWDVVLQTPTELGYAGVDLLEGTSEQTMLLERNLDDPWLPQVEGTPEHHAWTVFARHPFVGRHEGRLILGDGRYARAALPGWCNLAVEPPAGSEGR
jgi:inner membrane protein